MLSLLYSWIEKKSNVQQTKEKVAMQSTSRSQHLQNLAVVTYDAEKNPSILWSSDDETAGNFQVNSQEITGM